MGRPLEDLADKETYVRTLLLQIFVGHFRLDLLLLWLIDNAGLKCYIWLCLDLVLELILLFRQCWSFFDASKFCSTSWLLVNVIVGWTLVCSSWPIKWKEERQLNGSAIGPIFCFFLMSFMYRVIGTLIFVNSYLVKSQTVCNVRKFHITFSEKLTEKRIGGNIWCKWWLTLSTVFHNVSFLS